MMTLAAQSQPVQTRSLDPLTTRHSGLGSTSSQSLFSFVAAAFAALDSASELRLYATSLRNYLVVRLPC